MENRTLIAAEDDWVVIKGPTYKERNFNSFIQEKVIPFIHKSTTSASLDSIHENWNDSVSLDIEPTQISSITIPTIQDEDIDVEEHLVTIQVRNCGISLKEVGWKYSSPILQDAGRVKVQVNNATITIGLSYSVDKLIFLKLQLISFRLDIVSIDISISHCKGSYVYDLLWKLFSRRLQKMISEKINSLVCQHAPKEVSVPWVKALTMK